MALGGIVTGCMVFIAQWVWRLSDKLVGPEGGAGPSGGGVHPMDLPGDGRSPHDRFLRELLTPEPTSGPNV